MQQSRQPTVQLPIPSGQKICFTYGQQGHTWRNSPQEMGVQQLPGAAVAPPPVCLQIVPVATLRSNATVIMWQVGNVRVEVILDTGSAVSLVCCKEARLMNTHQAAQGTPAIELITASGEPLPVMACVKAPIPVRPSKQTSVSCFSFPDLVNPVILGTDFLCQHQIHQSQ